MAATATRDEKSLSPAEKKIMKMGFAQGAKEIRKKVSAALGHLADPAWMTGGDLVAGFSGMAVDLGGGMLTEKLAQPANVGDAPNFVARNREYVSGGLSMGLGATAYAANLAISGSRATPLRVGVRTATTTAFFMGMRRVLCKKFPKSLPQY
ncbi:MAG: hypothetical protein U1A78_41750 [Polyangia bacterium]